ncbi:MAG: type I restriction endonuclease subunit R [Vicingaceae bacterium]
MTTESEAILEQKLISQLDDLGYEKVVIQDENALIANLKKKLEKHNHLILSEGEFKQVLNHISKGNIYERAKILRDKVQYLKDDGSTGYLELLDQVNWCKNQYQVTHQVTIEGKYENRYDVTLLINGLPLVQIELKKRGLEMKEAFKQTLRYHRHSYPAGSGLFQFIQLFVISNGVNTKYYCNNPIKAKTFKQTFFWAKEDNKSITNLPEFAEVFLEPCHVSKMIAKYMVLNTFNQMMVLRPYQYYAAEAIVNRVKSSNKFGYIWHTTGSGKTLTSFKAAQVLTELEKVHKVVFVVDRKDLDYQTIKEFNSFSSGSIDATNNTSTLVKQLSDDTPLIVTTIQKLNNGIVKERYLKRLEHLRDKKVIFIFDECHRSQFGDTHQRIKQFFEGAQMFGFTGTPIFKDNAVKGARGKKTTKDLFEKCLHKYVITDAIRDRNVLKFSIEYINTYSAAEEIQDIKVEDINTQEVMEAPERVDLITDNIIQNHKRKTHNKEYTAIFCVSSIDMLIDYYRNFKLKKQQGEHDLKVATIFSFGANEGGDNDIGIFFGDDLEEDQDSMTSKVYREVLDDFIGDYNEMFNMSYSTNDFYGYYQDIGKRVKHRQVDILLVVNMFLTGFDSKLLNTIYVDKNLRYHGLIQAFSRTNRIIDDKKSQGNVVCYRNLKKATDEAIALFSNKDAIEEITIQPYEHYVEKFNEALAKLKDIAPHIDSVNELASEEEEEAFVKAFREMMRAKNVLDTFTEFKQNDLNIEEQEYANYKSKYLDLYELVKFGNQKEKVSILNDIDFEIELIRRDEINVAYIIKLLAQLHGAKQEEQEKLKKTISEQMDQNEQMRSKKELIERFMSENLPMVREVDDIEDAFDDFWKGEKKKAVVELAKEEELNFDGLVEIISVYIFTQKEPLRDDLIKLRNNPPGLKERASVGERIKEKIIEFVNTFIEGMG